MFAKIAVDTKTSTVDRIFEYIVPPHLECETRAGVRCSVPFGGGNRQRVGIILSLSEKSEYPAEKLKGIISVLDEKPLLSRERLVEAFRIKQRYMCSFMEAIKLFLPVGAKTDIDEIYVALETEKLLPEGVKGDILKEFRGGKIKYEALKEKFGQNVRTHLKTLREEGYIKAEFCWSDNASAKHINVYYLEKIDIDFKNIPQNATAQRRVLKVLSETPYLSMPDLCMFAGCSSGAVKTLVKKGIVSEKTIEKQRTPYADRRKSDEEIILSPVQKNAVNKILESEKPVLLRGVTGSGKTQIYIKAIEKVLEEGKSAIVLVPEISLTHQLVSRFIKVFGERVALLHSKLSEGERFDEWMRIANTEANVIIGARSAVFAPCDNTGIIIVDEEHEDSYKSESGVRYDAREVALLRASGTGAKVLFASATPRIEDYYKGKTGIYTLVEIEERYNNVPMPKAIIADMREELRSGNRSPVSRVLAEEMRQNLSEDEQTILFLNRRGYSTFISCRDCGEVIKCPACNISLTYHSYGEYLMCHYCGHKESVPEVCPACGSKNIRGFGTGTQKIEEKIEEEFGGASILRMDVDTTSGKGAHEKILDSFQSDGIDILLGTQMVAKGLDFENVTLVGVLAADQILNMGDFRAAEKTFDLITQVCGRSGRGEKEGRSVIQTYMPENSTIQYASKHDYKNFYEEEIKLRRLLNYPPFCDIVNIILFGDDVDSVKRKIEKLFKNFEKELSGKNVIFYPPVPCLVDKIKNKYRWHFWFKCSFTADVSDAVRGILEKENSPNIIAEINPSGI